MESEFMGSESELMDSDPDSWYPASFRSISAGPLQPHPHRPLAASDAL
jgi:hypothetical protein